MLEKNVITKLYFYIVLICSRQNISNLQVERKAISLLGPNVLTCQYLALSTCLEAECHFGFFLLFFQYVVTSRPVLPPETLGNQIVLSSSAHIQWILTL